MKELEVNAKTVDEAIQTALEQFGVNEDQVEVVVVKKGRSGVLGVGAEEAQVRVKLLDRPRSQNNVAKEAKEVLEMLVKCLGIVAEVQVTQVSEGELPIALDIEGDDLGVLIGRRGQALASLQYIVRLIVTEKLKTWAPINIDVAGYKKRRYEALHSLALRVADQVETSRRSINLEPMPADERRIIHMALADHPEVTTQSMDEGERRKVVILLRKR